MKAMNDFVKLLLAFLFGAGGLALINVIQERWKWRAERRAKKEDRKEEKEDTLTEVTNMLSSFVEQQKKFNKDMEEKQKKQDDEMKALSEGLRYVILDRILFIGQSYIKHGEVTFDDRKRLREMHDCYHTRLGGNGDAKHIMDSVDKLPLKQSS